MIFEAGQKYVITKDARALSIARVVEVVGNFATLEFSLAGRTRRYTWRIRVLRSSYGRKTGESIVPSEYDAIFARDALGK